MKEYLTKRIYGGIVFALAAFGTTILAVAISGTIKTWTTGEVLKSTDLNTTITSLKTAIEGIPNWTKATNGTDAYYTSGKVGIGTSSPITPLHVSSNTTGTLLTLERTGSQTGKWSLGVDTNEFRLIDEVALSTRFFIASDGKVGIGTQSPSQLLTINGNAGNTTGVWVNNSDIRLKKNIQSLGDFLGKLTKLRPVTFEWKDPKKLNAKDGKHIGFIAQEVEKIFPYWVDTDKAGMKWLSMEGVNAAFVQSFKEVALRLSSLELKNDSINIVIQKIKALEHEKIANERKVSTLEGENKKLLERLSKLEMSLQLIIALQKKNRDTIVTK